MASLAEGVRILLICPCGTLERFRAANEVILHLLRDPVVRRWGGLTYSSVADPSFTGAFWHDGRDGWETDQHVLVFIDVVGHPEPLGADFAARLRDTVAAIYRRHGAEQRHVWVTLQPLQAPCDEERAAPHPT